MSQENNISVENNLIVVKPLKAPIVVKKDNIKLFHGEKSNQLLIKNIKFGPASSIYQEDVIYQSQPGDFLRDSPRNVVIINRFDLLKCANRTVVKHTDEDGIEVETTSDQITKFIGQSNYDLVFSALCSVTDEQLKVKSIMALLTKISVGDQSTQTSCTEDADGHFSVKREASVDTLDKVCQTVENSMEILYKFKQKRRIKVTGVTPYVVKDNYEPPKKIIKRVIVNPTNFQKRNKEKIEKSMPPVIKAEMEELPVPSKVDANNDTHILPNLEVRNEDLNEDSCDKVSVLSGLSNFSRSVPSEVVEDLMGEIGLRIKEPPTEPVVNRYAIILPDKSEVKVPVKPEHPFHVATPEILKYLSNEDKKKIMLYQLKLDFTHCLIRDPDGYLPIHHAVLNNDVGLVRRQAYMLRRRQNTVDLTAGNLTALQMSIYNQETPECTAALLQNGADPLYADEESRTCLHLASESPTDHLRAILNHCESCARDVLQDHEELWKAEYESKTDKELGAILLKQVCSMFDSQGYTPLMRAALSGNYTGVKMLVEASPDCVNVAMRNFGNTALFLAVAEACVDATNRGNKSKVADHFFRTISILIEHGADVTIANEMGTTVSDLLFESNNAELSKLFANTITSVKYFDGNLPLGSKFDDFMLLKNKKGDVGIVEMVPKLSVQNHLKILENRQLGKNHKHKIKRPVEIKIISPNDDLVKLKNLDNASKGKVIEIKLENISNNPITVLGSSDCIQQNNCNTKTIQDCPTSGQICTNAGQTSVNTGQTSVNIEQVSVRTGQVSVNTNKQIVSSGQTSVNTGQVSINTGQTSVITGQVSVNKGQISVSPGQTSVNTGQISASTGQAIASTSQISSTGKKRRSLLKKIIPIQSNIIIKPNPTKSVVVLPEKLEPKPPLTTSTVVEKRKKSPVKRKSDGPSGKRVKS